MSDGVAISQYDYPSDDMEKRAREWFEAALFSPENEKRFQLHLMAVENTATISFDDAMMLALAALTLADNGCEQNFPGWYRHHAVKLLRRAYNAVALEREARAAADAGLTQ